MLGHDPKTTCIGLILIVGSLLYLGMRAVQGVLSLEDVKALLGLATGAGFILAADGAPTPREGLQAIHDPHGLMDDAQYHHEQARLRRLADAEREKGTP